jgi:hypothetical protein
MVIALICHIIMGVSRRDADFILGALTLCLNLFRNSLEPSQSSAPQIPTTLDTLLSKFRVQGRFTEYAVCQICDKTHPPSASGAYPRRCDHKPSPEKECNALLVDEEGRPLKTFLYHAFPDYLARLLSDPLLEKAMDNALTSETNSDGRPETVKGPFQASYLREFRGGDGDVFCAGGPEGRYVFQLCVDFFNVEGMNVRGASTSCGIIALACLNLPIDIRYKLENMFLAGIIPGPKEPTRVALNHFLRPLIDDMCRAWHDGIFITQTALHRTGRSTKSIIANVICDLPAARKTSSLAPSISKIFCSVCNCWHELDDKGSIVKHWRRLLCRTDYEKWTKRDVAEMRQAAEQWRDASTTKEQEEIFERFGVRWSELWRLPYWDPTTQLVVDSMHCLFEGLAKFHFITILGLATPDDRKARMAFVWSFGVPEAVDEESDDDDMSDVVGQVDYVADVPRTTVVKWSRKQVKDVQKVHNTLRHPLRDVDHSEGLTEEELRRRLMQRLVQSLRFVANDLGCEVTPSGSRGVVGKADYVAALIGWVSYSLIFTSI